MRILNSLLKPSSRLFKSVFIQRKQPSKDVVSSEIIRRIEKKFERLVGSTSKSLLAKHLNENLLQRLDRLETTYGSNLFDCIRSGLLYHDAKVGAYATDPETYKLFADLFNPIIKDIHNFGPNDKHKPQEFGNLEVFKDIDPYQHHILSTRIRVYRNLEAYPFIPKMEHKHFEEMEEGVLEVIKTFPEELKGFYVPHATLFGAAKERLIRNHMYKEPNRFMEAAGLLRYFPKYRAIYFTIDRKFVILTNYEDHLKIISMEQGADFCTVYERLINAIKLFHAQYSFHMDKRLGILTCSPGNLGTGMRASFLIKLVKFPKQERRFQNFLKKYDLQVRGTYGHHTPIIDHVYDISNKHSLGLSEYDIVRNVYEAAIELITLEKCAPACN